MGNPEGLDPKGRPLQYHLIIALAKLLVRGDYPQAQLLKSVDHGGKTLETWLHDKFFTQHCKREICGAY